MDLLETELKPNLSRFSSVYCSSKTKNNTTPNAVTSDQNIYRPPHLNPVYYEDKSKSNAKDRAKKRAARFILEDLEVAEAEDIPKEIHFGAHRGDAVYKRKLAEKQQYEEENFLRLQVTKSERQMKRRLAHGDVFETSTRDKFMELLLQSSDEELNYKAPLTKKKRKKLKRIRYKKIKRK